MAAAQIIISSNPGIECMVAQNPILSDPDGGGTNPQILKPRDMVHGGTRTTYCQIRMVAAQILRTSNPGIECMVAQNPILSDPDGGGTAAPHIQG
jgi:hypothetical protein